MRISDWSSDVCSSDLERPRAPLGHIELLHFVHEVNTDRVLRAGIERGEHPRLAIGVDDLDLLETGVAGQLRHVLRTFARVEVFGRDRRHRDPVLQPLDRFIVLRFDLLPDGIERSEEHTSELQSLMRISYAVFCLKKNIYHTIKLYS